MTLKETIASDATAVFLNTSDFAESATYYPKQYYGETARAARPITIDVYRDSFTVVNEDGETIMPVYEVHVYNDSTLGISSDEIDLGGDLLAFPPRPGKAAESKAILQIIDQDEGMLVLQCQ